MITFLSGILDSHFFSKGHSEPLRLLEVGCGAGHFARLVSSHYGSKIHVTGLDSSSVIVAEAKSLSEGLVEDGSLQFVEADFNTYSNPEPFDVILFTKSFHHCLPMDQATRNVRTLLKNHGLMVAEEIIRDPPHTSSTRWFFDRVDLLNAANLIDISNAGYGSHNQQPSHSNADREPHTHGSYALGHGSHDPAQYRGQHGHNHSHEAPSQDQAQAHDHGQDEGHGHSHGHGHGHSHNPDPAVMHERLIKFLDPKLDSNDRWQAILPKSGGLAEKQDIIDAIVNEFGAEHTRITDILPFLYHFIVFAGLKNNEAGHAALATFMVQEEIAVRLGEIRPVGLTIVAEKNE
ncbi:unnamed protein product [Umbelopsis sp. WA50703]